MSNLKKEIQMKKNLLILLLMLTMAALLIGCNGDEDYYPETETETEVLEEGLEEEVTVDEVQPEVEDIEEDGQEVEERVLVDENNIRITLTSMSSSWLGEEINVRIENDNDHPITVQVRHMSINGLMIDAPVFSPTIAAGMMANDSISVMSSEIENNSIENIGIIELQFIAFEDFFTDYILDTDVITIETSMVNQINQTLPENRVELFNQDGITIYHTGYSEGELGEFNVKFFIVNNTHELVTVQAREESVNGIMIMGTMSADIMPNKATNTTLGFFSWDLEANNIDDVETISFYLYIFPDWDFMRDGIQTEIITLNF